MAYEESSRLSPRLRDALVADLLQEASDLEEFDRVRQRRPRDEHEAVEELARQLGVATTQGLAGIHATFIIILPELDRMLREWPLPSDRKPCDVVAQAATKSLSEVENFATLHAGPTSWRQTSITGGTVASAGPQFRRIVHRALSSSLHQLLERWSQWDIPHLRDRWQNARRQQEESAAEQARLAAKRRGPRRRVAGQSREDAEKFRRAASYRPPDRIT